MGGYFSSYATTAENETTQSGINNDATESVEIPEPTNDTTSPQFEIEINTDALTYTEKQVTELVEGFVVKMINHRDQFSDSTNDLLSECSGEFLTNATNQIIELFNDSEYVETCLTYLASDPEDTTDVQICEPLIEIFPIFDKMSAEQQATYFNDYLEFIRTNNE